MDYQPFGDEDEYYGYTDYDSYALPEVLEDEFETDNGFAGAYPVYKQSPELSGVRNAPGPGLIAVVTVTICALMAFFLLRLAAGIVIAPVLQAVQPVPQPAARPAAAAPVQTGAAEAANFACQVSSLFPEKVTRWCGLISFYAATYNLSPDLIAALIWQESGGNETAYSKSGAVGLMQVMPSDGLAASFMCANGPCFSDRPSTSELQNPEFNIAWGTKYLAGLLHRHGDVREALKSYGPMDVGYYYADKVLGLFERYKTPMPSP